MQNYVAEESGGEEDTNEMKEPLTDAKGTETSHEECAGLEVDPEDSFPNKDDFSTIKEEEEGEKEEEFIEETNDNSSETDSVGCKSKPIPIPGMSTSSVSSGQSNGTRGTEIITQDVSSSLPNQNLFRSEGVNKMATQTAFTAMMSVWEPVRAFVSRLQNLNATPVKFSFPKFSIPSWMWGGSGDSKEKETKTTTDDIKIDMGDDDDDLFMFGNMPTSTQNQQKYMSSDLFMGKYSEKDIWKIINELKPHIFGKTIRQLLESRGYKDIALEMDTSDPFVHKLNLYYVGNLKRKEDETKESTQENGTYTLFGPSSSSTTTTSSSSTATTSSSSTSLNSANSSSSQQQQQQQQQNEAPRSFWSFFNSNSNNNAKKKEDTNENKNSTNNGDENSSGGNNSNNGGGSGSTGIWPFSLLGTRTPEKKKIEKKSGGGEVEKDSGSEKTKEKEGERVLLNENDKETLSESEELVRSPSPTLIGISSPPVSRRDLFQNIPDIQTKDNDLILPQPEIQSQSSSTVTIINENNTKQSPATDKLFTSENDDDDEDDDKGERGEPQPPITQPPTSPLTKDLENDTFENDIDDDVSNDDDNDDDDDADDDGTGHKKFSPNKLLAQLFVRRETSFSVMETKSFTCKESGVPNFYAKAFNDGLHVLRNFFKTEKLQMVVVEWLRMQDPLKSFGERTPLPGQLHPGLGLGNDAAKIFCTLARNKGRDGILNLPEHFYNAYLYAQGFNLYHFLNPAFEGYFKSICKAIEPDIKKHGISAVAWAVFRGMLHCRMVDGDVADDREGNGEKDDTSVPVQVTPARIKWVSQEQVCPLSGRMTKYFKSSEYANAVKKAYHPEAFFIMWEHLEDDSYISTSCPN